MATGGSTNHTLHLIAIARAAGIDLNWQDMDRLSRVVPLLARVYPNGAADINDFQAAGGMAFLTRELRAGGLLNEDVVTLLGSGLDAHSCAPITTTDKEVSWTQAITQSTRADVLRPVTDPFVAEGGLRALSGNLGESVIKTSSVEAQYHNVKAPCRVFSSQEAIKTAFEQGELDLDVIVVVRFQGPAANGMPELHKMTPYLGVLQDRGFKVALVTDGRMSGASGKVPAAIHLSPEAIESGPIGLLLDGDVIELNVEEGALNVLVSQEVWATRTQAKADAVDSTLGRGLFEVFRRNVSVATRGGSVFDQV